MPYENIRTEKDGTAFVITLDRPARRNAVSLATMGEMIAAADEAAADPAVRGVVVTGGADYFSAGADLNDALAIQGAADRSEEHTSELQSLMRISYAVFCL